MYILPPRESQVGFDGIAKVWRYCTKYRDNFSIIGIHIKCWADTLMINSQKKVEKECEIYYNIKV